MRCPHCGSSSVQKSSAFYEQGVRESVGSSTGWFLTSRGSVGVGSWKRHSQSQSLAASRNAPQYVISPKSWLVVLAGFALSFWPISYMWDAFWDLDLGGVLLYFILAFLLIGAAMIGAIILNTDGREAMKAWESQWYCRKCGGLFFEPAAASHMPAAAPTSFVSPVMRSAQARLREEYRDRVVSPVQCAGRMTERDRAGLDAIAARVAADGSFDPERIGCDLGIISRLSSLKAIEYEEGTDRFLITKLKQEPRYAAVQEPRRGWWQRTFG